MMRATLFGLTVAVSLLASPVFAAADLCSINIKKIQNMKPTAAQNPDQTGKISAALVAAKASRAKGDNEDCIARTGKILNDLSNTKVGGTTGG